MLDFPRALAQFIRYRVLGLTKKRAKVSLRRPDYANRHPGGEFLILVTGPNVAAHAPAIHAFIEHRKPIVLAINRAPEGFETHYHLFTNKGRFQQYGRDARPLWKLLLNPAFPATVIRSIAGTRPYDALMCADRYPGERGWARIEDGIIHSEGATAAVTAIGVALVMGARRVWVAGMDGYSIHGEKTHYYTEPDNKERETLLHQERLTTAILADLARIAREQDAEIAILTPTAYRDHYRPGILESPHQGG